MRWRRAQLAWVALASCLCVLPAGAQQVVCDGGLREVHKVDFRGNTTYRDDQLSVLIVTTPSTWARRFLKVFGTRLCYDSTVVVQDARRLAFYYLERGFRGTRVKPELVRQDAKSVEVRFDIHRRLFSFQCSPIANGDERGPIVGVRPLCAYCRLGAS